jgi:GNAT superfamily N-acetyltransferase
MSKTDITIRPATNADAPAVREMIFSILREFDLQPDPEKTDADLNDLESTYIKPGGRFDVMVDDIGRIIGSVGLLRIDSRTVELRKMYLLGTARGKGLGRRLLAHAIDESRLLGFARITLETQSRLTTAIEMYTRAGFRPTRDAIHTKRCDQAYELCLT